MDFLQLQVLFVITPLQTFIRNAVGKALKDSPALNANSRAVLVPVARLSLPPGAVNVPGPGPVESHRDQRSELEETAPPLPTKSDLPATPSSTDEDDELIGESNGDDPYSKLDSAFGNYLADEPRPIDGRRHADDDLLF